MEMEEKIKVELEDKFSYLKNAVIIKRDNRIFVDVSLDKFSEVFSYVVEQAGFEGLSAITGMDLGDSFAVLYHLKKKGKIVLTLRFGLSKDDPTINTVTTTFPCADLYEREIMDLLGIKVMGLPEANRYPLPDNWPKNDYPLRKEWQANKARANKEGVQDA